MEKSATRKFHGDASASAPTINHIEQWPECPLVAQSGHSTTKFRCPLWGVKRTCCDVRFDRMRHWRLASAAKHNEGLCQLRSKRNGMIASATKSGNSSCTESLPSGNIAVRMLATDANASISARERDGV